MDDECIKCGYIGDKNNKFGLIFCNVCYKFCPNNPEEVDKYSQEKIEGETLNPLRGSGLPHISPAPPRTFLPP